MSVSPKISVIIPTAGRPDLVTRAVNSALGQSFNEIEVIVVVDGYNQDTVAALSCIADPRLRILQNPSCLGPGGARNRGAEEARGIWLAFLDDDDEWLPKKLERQLDAARVHTGPVVVTCLSHVINSSGNFIWPREIYDNNGPFEEYLFDRRSLFKGEAFVPTPSLLMSRELFNAFKFPALSHHEDWDLLLRLLKIGRAKLVTLDEPLAIVHYEESRLSLSNSSTWKSSIRWIENCQVPISRRAYSGYCLTIAGPEAARVGDYSAFIPLLRRSFESGAPTTMQLVLYATFWATPGYVRQRLRRWVSRMLAA